MGKERYLPDTAAYGMPQADLYNQIMEAERIAAQKKKQDAYADVALPEDYTKSKDKVLQRDASQDNKPYWMTRGEYEAARKLKEAQDKRREYDKMQVPIVIDEAKYQYDKDVNIEDVYSGIAAGSLKLVGNDLYRQYKAKDGSIQIEQVPIYKILYDGAVKPYHYGQDAKASSTNDPLGFRNVFTGRVGSWLAGQGVNTESEFREHARSSTIAENKGFWNGLLNAIDNPAHAITNSLLDILYPSRIHEPSTYTRRLSSDPSYQTGTIGGELTEGLATIAPLAVVTGGLGLGVPATTAIVSTPQLLRDLGQVTSGQVSPLAGAANAATTVLGTGAGIKMGLNAIPRIAGKQGVGKIAQIIKEGAKQGTIGAGMGTIAGGVEATKDIEPLSTGKMIEKHVLPNAVTMLFTAAAVEIGMNGIRGFSTQGKAEQAKAVADVNNASSYILRNKPDISFDDYKAHMGDFLKIEDAAAAETAMREMYLGWQELYKNFPQSPLLQDFNYGFAAQAMPDGSIKFAPTEIPKAELPTPATGKYKPTAQQVQEATPKLPTLQEINDATPPIINQARRITTSNYINTNSSTPIKKWITGTYGKRWKPGQEVPDGVTQGMQQIYDAVKGENAIDNVPFSEVIKLTEDVLNGELVIPKNMEASITKAPYLESSIINKGNSGAGLDYNFADNIEKNILPDVERRVIVEWLISEESKKGMDRGGAIKSLMDKFEIDPLSEVSPATLVNKLKQGKWNPEQIMEIYRQGLPKKGGTKEVKEEITPAEVKAQTGIEQPVSESTEGQTVMMGGREYTLKQIDDAIELASETSPEAAAALRAKADEAIKAQTAPPEEVPLPEMPAQELAPPVIDVAELTPPVRKLTPKQARADYKAYKKKIESISDREARLDELDAQINDMVKKGYEEFAIEPYKNLYYKTLNEQSIEREASKPTVVTKVEEAVDAKKKAPPPPPQDLTLTEEPTSIKVNNQDIAPEYNPQSDFSAEVLNLKTGTYVIAGSGDAWSIFTPDFTRVKGKVYSTSDEAKRAISNMVRVNTNQWNNVVESPMTEALRKKLGAAAILTSLGYSFYDEDSEDDTVRNAMALGLFVAGAVAIGAPAANRINPSHPVIQNKADYFAMNNSLAVGRLRIMGAPQAVIDDAIKSALDTYVADEALTPIATKVSEMLGNRNLNITSNIAGSGLTTDPTTGLTGHYNPFIKVFEYVFKAKSKINEMKDRHGFYLDTYNTGLTPEVHDIVAGVNEKVKVTVARDKSVYSGETLANAIENTTSETTIKNAIIEDIKDRSGVALTPDNPFVLETYSKYNEYRDFQDVLTENHMATRLYKHTGYYPDEIPEQYPKLLDIVKEYEDAKAYIKILDEEVANAADDIQIAETQAKLYEAESLAEQLRPQADEAERTMKIFDRYDKFITQSSLEHYVPTWQLTADNPYGLRFIAVDENGKAITPSIQSPANLAASYSSKSKMYKAQEELLTRYHAEDLGDGYFMIDSFDHTGKAGKERVRIRIGYPYYFDQYTPQQMNRIISKIYPLLQTKGLGADPLLIRKNLDAFSDNINTRKAVQAAHEVGDIVDDAVLYELDGGYIPPDALEWMTDVRDMMKEYVRLSDPDLVLKALKNLLTKISSPPETVFPSRPYGGTYNGDAVPRLVYNNGKFSLATKGGSKYIPYRDMGKFFKKTATNGPITDASSLVNSAAEQGLENIIADRLERGINSQVTRTAQGLIDAIKKPGYRAETKFAYEANKIVDRIVTPPFVISKLIGNALAFLKNLSGGGSASFAYYADIYGLLEANAIMARSTSYIETAEAAGKKIAGKISDVVSKLLNKKSPVYQRIATAEGAQNSSAIISHSEYYDMAMSMLEQAGTFSEQPFKQVYEGSNLFDTRSLFFIQRAGEYLLRRMTASQTIMAVERMNPKPEGMSKIEYANYLRNEAYIAVGSTQGFFDMIYRNPLERATMGNSSVAPFTKSLMILQSPGVAMGAMWHDRYRRLVMGGRRIPALKALITWATCSVLLGGLRDNIPVISDIYSFVDWWLSDAEKYDEEDTPLITEQGVGILWGKLRRWASDNGISNETFNKMRGAVEFGFFSELPQEGAYQMIPAQLAYREGLMGYIQLPLNIEGVTEMSSGAYNFAQTLANTNFTSDEMASIGKAIIKPIMPTTPERWMDAIVEFNRTDMYYGGDIYRAVGTGFFGRRPIDLQRREEKRDKGWIRTPARRREFTIKLFNSPHINIMINGENITSKIRRGIEGNLGRSGEVYPANSILYDSFKVAQMVMDDPYYAHDSFIRNYESPGTQQLVNRGQEKAQTFIEKHENLFTGFASGNQIYMQKPYVIDNQEVRLEKEFIPYQFDKKVEQMKKGFINDVADYYQNNTSALVLSQMYEAYSSANKKNLNVRIEYNTNTQLLSKTKYLSAFYDYSKYGENATIGMLPEEDRGYVYALTKLLDKANPYYKLEE